MEEKRISNFDILIYASAIFSTFILFIISNKLSAPLIIEINLGASIIDLMFNSEDSISFFQNLFTPLLLLIIGIVILSKSLWNIVKIIFIEEDSIINKTILGILSFILFAVLIKALINSWSLFLLALICTIISFVIFAMLGSLINSTSDLQKERSFLAGNAAYKGPIIDGVICPRLDGYTRIIVSVPGTQDYGMLALNLLRFKVQQSTSIPAPLQSGKVPFIHK